MRERRRGSQAVEFALMLPVILVIIAGIVDYGWFFYLQQGVVNATREAARAGAATSRYGDPAAEAVTRGYDALEEYGLDSTDAKVSATLSGTSPNQMVSVQVAIAHEPFFTLLPTPKVASSSLTLRWIYQP